MNMEEIWKDIVGYEGKYMVSNLGRVKSIKWKGINKETIFTPWLNRYGYPMVTLRKDRTKTSYTIHRLEYEAFYGPIPEGLQVNHINEIKTDNRLENLNLMTAQENCVWGTRTKRIMKYIKKPVIQLLPDGTEFCMYFSATDAERETGISHQTISKCCKGKINTSGGFKWRYGSDR